MKLEYLADGSPDCPLIRLYDFTPLEAEQLHEKLSALADGTLTRLELHTLSFIEVIGDCQLTLIRRGWDQAIIRMARPTQFECGLTAGSWENMAALVEPFTEDASGFQWLNGTPGKAKLLLTVLVSGQW